MKSRIRFAIWAVFLSLPGLASGQDALPLSQISDYLNDLKTAQTTFTQYNEDGSRSIGTLLVKRPGRMRFEYEPPNQAIVIAGAGAVIIHDKKSNQPPETYPLKRTPLNLILARRVDLDQANMVVGHAHDGEFTVVRAQDPENPEFGYIDLKFSHEPIALRQWIITNDQGVRTAVVLNDFTTGISLSDTLFDTQVGVNGANR